jgi:hypothetical protein
MYNDDVLIVAQINDNLTDASSSSSSNQTDESNHNDNFSIEGIITPDSEDIAVQTGGLISNQSMSSVSNSTTLSHDKILGGKWKIDVVKGNVEYFESNMTMVESTGTDMHDHLIEFKSDDPDILLLPNDTAVISPDPATVEIAALNFAQNNKNITSISRSDGTVVFSGVADILTNGVIEWREVPTSVSINGNVINIKLEPKIVTNHFSETPIYGSVSSIEPLIVIQNGTG